VAFSRILLIPKLSVNIAARAYSANDYLLLNIKHFVDDAVPTNAQAVETRKLSVQGLPGTWRIAEFP